MEGISIGTLVNGLILGNDYVLIALAITLIYKHSKYIPLWISVMGTSALKP